MDRLDELLIRATEIALDETTDRAKIAEYLSELEDVLPSLVDGGYVAFVLGPPGGHFWRFTPEGVDRQRALGLLG